MVFIRSKWVGLVLILIFIGAVVTTIVYAASKSTVQNQSEGRAECGLVRLTVREILAGENEGKYRLTARLYHYARVRDNRPAFIPDGPNDKEHINRTASFGYGGFFYHDNENFADVDRANCQNFGGNENIN